MCCIFSNKIPRYVAVDSVIVWIMNTDIYGIIDIIDIIDTISSVYTGLTTA